MNDGIKIEFSGVGGEPIKDDDLNDFEQKVQNFASRISSDLNRVLQSSPGSLEEDDLRKEQAQVSRFRSYVDRNVPNAHRYSVYHLFSGSTPDPEETTESREDFPGGLLKRFMNLGIAGREIWLNNLEKKEEK